MFRSWRAEGGLQEQRQKFLYDLNTKIKLIGLKATIVFDAQYASSDFSKTYFDSLEIIFTAKGETADELILKEIKNSNNPQLYTVITSDKGLASQIKSCHAKTQSIENFIDELNRRYRNKIRRSAHPKETKKVREARVIEKLKEQCKDKGKKTGLLKPILNISESENFAWYLEIFEKRFVEETDQETIKNKPKPKNTRKIRPFDNEI